MSSATFDALLNAAGQGASLGRLGDACCLLKAGTHLCGIGLHRDLDRLRFHVAPRSSATHACYAAEVERKVSNLMAHLPEPDHLQIGPKSGITAGGL